MNSIGPGPSNIIADPNNPGRSAELDNLFPYQVQIAEQHHKIHEGQSFEVHCEGGFDTHETITAAFRVPAGDISPHLVLDWRVSDVAMLELLRNPTWTTGTGTAIPIQNNDIASSNTSILEEDLTATPAWTSNAILKDPDGLTGGTCIETQYAFTAKQAGGTSASGRQEWILVPGETYAVRITRDNVDCLMGIVLRFYESLAE